MLTAIEKEIAVKHSMEYFVDTNGKLLFKILVNYLSNVPELNKELSNLTEDIFSDENKMQIYAQKMIEYMTNAATQCKTYTTGQLATFFGVSVTSINNWINEGRFINLPPKLKNKQARILENVMWKSPMGELIPVFEVVQMYNEGVRDNGSREQELIDIRESISFFEDKYGGSYELTLKDKVGKTEEELRDEAEWKYLSRRLEKS